MRLAALALSLVVVAAGCGSDSPKKQAEDVHSFAAEGALLAHEAAAGDATVPFTRVHAERLHEEAEKVVKSAENARVKDLAVRVARELEALERKPGDARRAAAVEKSLRTLARAAEKLASGA